MLFFFLVSIKYGLETTPVLVNHWNNYSCSICNKHTWKIPHTHTPAVFPHKKMYKSCQTHTITRASRNFRATHKQPAVDAAVTTAAFVVAAVRWYMQKGETRKQSKIDVHTHTNAERNGGKPSAQHTTHITTQHTQHSVDSVSARIRKSNPNAIDRIFVWIDYCAKKSSNLMQLNVYCWDGFGNAGNSVSIASTIHTEDAVDIAPEK